MMQNALRADTRARQRLGTVTSAVLALALFAACSFGARAVAHFFYDRYWPGHPDSFRAETALLPGLSFHAWWRYFWQDREQALIFLSACCVFTLPQIVALAATRGRFAAYLVAFVTIAIGASALWDIWQRYDSYLRIFFPQKHTIPQGRQMGVERRCLGDRLIRRGPAGRRLHPRAGAQAMLRARVLSKVRI